MTSMIVTLALGILLCVIGVVNTTGNVTSLHSYHRKRVSQEDMKPFGILVGIGTIIIGLAIAALGILLYVHERTEIKAYAIAGTVTVISGLVVGLGISFFAMIKYNKGIF